MRTLTLLFVVVVLLLLIFVGFVIYYTFFQDSANVGSKCLTNKDCLGNTVCDPISKTCKVRVGETCSKTSECLSGSICAAGRCVPLRPGRKSRPPVNKIPEKIVVTQPPVSSDKIPTPPPQMPSSELPGSQPPPPVVVPEVQVPVPISLPPPVAETYHPSVYLGTESLQIRSPAGTDDASANSSCRIGTYGTDGVGTGCSRDYSVRSQFSTEDIECGVQNFRNSSSSGDPSTPYLIQEGLRYCKCGGGAGISIERAPTELVTRPGRGVLDVISYSKMVIFLHQDGRITWEQEGKRHKVRCNIKADKLEKHAGYLYALSSGMLYSLDNGSLSSTSRWQWNICPWSPASICHTSSTLDGKYLWVQDSSRGYLYNQKLEVIETVEISGTRRRYGYNLSDFITYDPTTCLASVTVAGATTEYEGVCRGLITREGQLIAIGRDDLENYTEVRLVNWVPYFISSCN